MVKQDQSPKPKAQRPKIPARLILQDKLPAAMNMAIDEALFTLWEPEKPWILRFYDWDRPAVTIGRLQQASTNCTRRPTGGGLVEHGKDITFSLIFTEKATPQTTYHRIHRALKKGLSTVGMETTFSNQENQEKYFGKDCFSLPVSYDLLFGKKKIAGGAQKRAKDKILHQGSIQKLPINMSRKSIIEAFSAGFREIFDLSFKKTGLSVQEQSLAEKLCTEKYSQDTWNRKR